MESSEVLLLIVFLWYGSVVWFNYYAHLFSLRRMLYQRLDHTLLLLVPVLCGIGLVHILKTYADSFVRAEPVYQLFYGLWGVSWVGFGKWLLPYLGFSVRDDGLERRNTAAATAVSGAFIGLTAAYAGGNIGDGPGWGVVALCVITSTVTFFLAWITLEYLTQISETITVERSMAAGIRLAALLIVLGVILGRSVSGNWIDFTEFVLSFVIRAWYVIPLVLAAVVIEAVSRPTVEHPRPSAIVYGVVPALAYIALSVVAVGLSPAAPV